MLAETITTVSAADGFAVYVQAPPKGPRKDGDQEGIGSARDQEGIGSRDQEGIGSARDQEGMGSARDQEGIGSRDQEGIGSGIKRE